MIDMSGWRRMSTVAVYAHAMWYRRLYPVDNSPAAQRARLNEIVSKWGPALQAMGDA